MFPHEGHMVEFTRPQSSIYPYSCNNSHCQSAASAGERVKVVVENIPKSVSDSELAQFFDKFPFVLSFFCISSVETNKFEGFVYVYVASFEMAHLLKSELQGRYFFINQLLPLNVTFPRIHCSPRAFHKGDHNYRSLNNNHYSSFVSPCVNPNTVKVSKNTMQNSNNDKNNRGSVVSVRCPFSVNSQHSNSTVATLSYALSALSPGYNPRSFPSTSSSSTNTFAAYPSCLHQGKFDPFWFHEKGVLIDGLGSTKEGPPGSNLFIYHLPATFSDYDLFDLFHSFGKILSAKVIVDLNTQMSRGYGFVSFDNPDSAQMAIDVMDGYAIGKKKLKVQRKVKK